MCPFTPNNPLYSLILGIVHLMFNIHPKLLFPKQSNRKLYKIKQKQVFLNDQFYNNNKQEHLEVRNCHRIYDSMIGYLIYKFLT